MKCPICGNEEFLNHFSNKGDVISVFGDASLTWKNESYYVICSKCGLVLTFNHTLSKYRDELNEKLTILDNKYNENKEKLDSFNKNINEISIYKVKLKKLKQEYEEMCGTQIPQSMLNAKLDSIHDYEKIIKEGKDPGIKYQFDKLTNENRKILEEIDLIKKKLENSIYNK